MYDAMVFVVENWIWFVVVWLLASAAMFAISMRGAK
jgi:hypothetical protein